MVEIKLHLPISTMQAIRPSAFASRLCWTKTKPFMALDSSKGEKCRSATRN